MTDHPDIVERLMALAERMAYVYAKEHTHATVPAAAEHAALESAMTAEITRLRAEAEALRKALVEAMTRMDRARDILTDGKPTPQCHWGMLSTEDLRDAIAATKEQQA